jgi:hypothetical protein
MSRPSQTGRLRSIGGSTSAEDLIKAAHMLLEEYEISMSPSKVSRIVRTYKHQVERNGFPFVDFLVNAVDISMHQRRADPNKARVISYADPTGEDAVHNVLSEIYERNALS